MKTQDIELLFNSFNQQVSNIKNQLTTLLVMVSDGKVPSEDIMSEFNTDMDSLRIRYNDIYMAVKDIVSDDEVPAEGESVNIYIEVAKKSKIRLIQKQMELAKGILTNFIAVKSRLDIYAQALAPYQEAASKLLSQISEKTIEDILPEMTKHQLFIDAMEIKNLGFPEKNLELMRKISHSYEWEVQAGLWTNQYYLMDRDKSISYLPEQELIAATKENEEITSQVVFDARQENFANIDTQNMAADNKKILTVFNRLKSGTPSASSFRKEITKMSRINKEIRTVIPLLTNIGIFSKEQCFLFGVCMNCGEEKEQFREAVNSAIDALTQKGYIAQFNYEENEKKKVAYCLSDYCNSCIRKESIASQMKGFWTLTFGNYKFFSGIEVEECEVVDAIHTNALLLKYIYTVHEILTEEEFSVIKRSIIWKEGYYQVKVYENNQYYRCHLISATEDIDKIVAKNILFCKNEDLEHSICCCSAENIFVLDKGAVHRWERNQNLTEISKTEQSSVNGGGF